MEALQKTTCGSLDIHFNSNSRKRLKLKEVRVEYLDHLAVSKVYYYSTPTLGSKGTVKLLGEGLCVNNLQ